MNFRIFCAFAKLFREKLRGTTESRKWVKRPSLSNRHGRVTNACGHSTPALKAIMLAMMQAIIEMLVQFN
jgi:hypothetical protein